MSASPPEVKPPARRWPRLVKRVCFIIGGSYLGILIVLLAFENRLVYHPTLASQDWMNPPTSEIQDVELTSADGTRLHAWWYRHPQARGAVLYLHGNAGNLSHRGGSVVKLRDGLGESVLIVDYPGYGKSEGRPSERGCYAAAEAAFEWLTTNQKVPAENIILYGGSLGGGVAIYLASEKPHRALVLVKTFTSAPDVASTIYPWLPARWVMRNRYDNLGRIGKCNKPVFIAHGDCDGIVPFEHGKRLFAAANEPKDFLVLEKCDHNDRLPDYFMPRLKKFLQETEVALRK